MSKVEEQPLDLLLAEMDALHTAAQVVDHGVDPQEALDLTRGAFGSAPVTKTFEASLVRCAMASILGEDVASLVPRATTTKLWVQHVYESLGRAWACWAADPSSTVPLEEVTRLRREQATREDVGSPRRAGAMHLIVLYFWAAGIEALAKQDVDEARRFWKRAIDVGASFGTESHPVVLWSYVASFWPHKRA